MDNQKLASGVDTTFKDKDGNTIHVHSYVKDTEGRKYFINSHCQAVPEGGDAPAVELSRLLEETEVTVMSAQEVLNAPSVEPKRRRAGLRRRSRKDAQDGAVQPVAEPIVAQPAGQLSPVDMRMVLSVIPDDVLAGELRRRGYYLTAVKPAVITL